MTKEMQTSIEAINKFIFYCYNHPSEPSGVTSIDEEDGHILSHWVPDFIMHADWTTNREHMIHKWLGFRTECDDIKCFHKFYGELDSQNAKAMLSWIMTNYNTERHLPFNNED